VIDKSLIGDTAENIFLSLLNQRGVFATSFATEGLDGVAFDPDNRLFKVGQSPFYVQIKSRNSDSANYKTKNFPHDRMRNIESFATNLGLPTDSLYFVVGFSRENDIRTMQYYGIPYVSLDRFRTDKGWYNFSVKSCEAAIQEDDSIFRI
jgi:hypothetical protein